MRALLRQSPIPTASNHGGTAPPASQLRSSTVLDPDMHGGLTLSPSHADWSDSGAAVTPPDLVTDLLPTFGLGSPSERLSSPAIVRCATSAVLYCAMTCRSQLLCAVLHWSFCLF